MAKYGRMVAGFAILVGVVIVGLLVLSMSAPQTSIAVVPTSETTSEATSEVPLDTTTLPQLPRISGNNLDDETLTFPQDFKTDYALVVMPFDRDQQTNAINWLPAFQRIQESNPTISYYSIAALEDLAPAVRLLVVQGLNFAVSDPATRQSTVVLFLSNQDEFIQALGISNMDTMRVLLLNKSGQVLWQTEGDYVPEKEADLLEWIALYITD